ncbi:hypothetical protein [Cytobacillus horneckiae]|uniref:hypothetical protein n=1 Tax=Cytobacillus horneckiae TaxID=549687 RepID=UPI003D9A1E81
MELVSAYVEIQENRKPILTLLDTTPPQREEKKEVDLGDLIERLKVQIDNKLGRV